MIIPFANLTGEVPRLRATRLPDNAAAGTSDCEFRHGVLTGIRANGAANIASGAQSIFITDNNKTLQFASDTNAVRSPVATDKFERVYWTNSSGFKVAPLKDDLVSSGTPSKIYDVGVPRPDTAPEIDKDTGVSNFAIGGVDVAANVGIDLMDVLADGTEANVWKDLVFKGRVNSNGTVTSTPISYKLVYNGRAPAKVESAKTSESSTATPATSDPMPLYDAYGQPMLNADGTQMTASQNNDNSGLQLSSTTTESGGNFPGLTTQAISVSATSGNKTNGGVITVGTVSEPFFVMTTQGATTPLTVTKMFDGTAFTDSSSSLSTANVTAKGALKKYPIFYKTTGTSSAALDIDVSYVDSKNETHTIKLWRVNKPPSATKASTVWYSSTKSTTLTALQAATTVKTTYASKGARMTCKLYDPKGKATKTVYVGLTEDLTSIPASITDLEASLEFKANETDATTGTWTLILSAKGESLETRDYVYTYVNEFGEEGPPSPVTTVECGSKSQVTIKSFAPMTSGYCPLSYYRIYRTATGTSTEFLYVTYDKDDSAEVGWPVTLPDGKTYTDDGDKTRLAESLSSQNNYPPSQDIRGLCTMANGMLAGFVGAEIHIMEPYLPFACDPNFIKPLPHNVVGICPFENGLYVTTEANPYLIMGNTPQSITDAKVPTVQAGVSKNSIIVIGNNVVYASHDGIVMARGLDASLEMSFNFFTRDVWRSICSFNGTSALGSINFHHHDGSLLIWFSSSQIAPMLMRMEEENPSLVRLSQTISGAFVHPTSDALYVQSSGSYHPFAGGDSHLGFTWISKEFTLPSPVCFGALQAFGSGDVTFEVFADGVSKYTKSVSLPSLFRLPSGFKAVKWQVKITGAAGSQIEQVFVAESISELKSV